MLEILLIPFIACLILTGIHCYLGIHVLMRGVIFVDLALAQVAAMGAAVAIAAGFSSGSTAAYFFALGFTILGAGVFSVARFQEHRVPQEAVIGIVYAVTSAVAILILSRSAGERDEIEHMLVGQLLFVDWPTILKTLAIYIPIALVHIAFRRPFLAISREGEGAVPTRMRLRAWDFLFYATFGVVVTSSVQIAGVLLVFCFLIVPAACAALFATGVWPRLLLGWGIGGLAGAVLLGTAILVFTPQLLAYQAINGDYAVYLVRLKLDHFQNDQSASEAIIDLTFQGKLVRPNDYQTVLNSEIEQQDCCSAPSSDLDIKVLPLLVSDHIEAALLSHREEEARQLALSLSAMLKGVGVGGSLPGLATALSRLKPLHHRIEQLLHRQVAHHHRRHLLRLIPTLMKFPHLLSRQALYHLNRP